MTYAFGPEIADVIPLLPAVNGADPAASRAFLSEMIALPAPDTTGVHFDDREVPGGAGDPAVTIRIYRPAQRRGRAAIYSVHGGGFIAGDLETEHALNIRLARELGVVVAAVDYRLAPETPFPGPPLEDLYAGLLWMAENAEELGIDLRRIAIHGASAGGGLCAALALLARERGRPHIAVQFLGVPELDDRLATPSMIAFTYTPLWDRPKAIAS